MITRLELINKIALRLDLAVGYNRSGAIVIADSDTTSKITNSTNNIASAADKVKELNELENILQDIAREVHAEASKLVRKSCDCKGFFHNEGCRFRVY